MNHELPPLLVATARARLHEGEPRALRAVTSAIEQRPDLEEAALRYVAEACVAAAKELS